MLATAVGCGKPDPSGRYQRPAEITDFGALFGKNCSGCHGAAGQFGPAPPLNDPLFQAIVSDEQLTSVIRKGRQGTLMPAFARSQGGPLTDQQIGIVVRGIRQRWAAPRSEQPREVPPYQVAPDDPAGLAHSDVTAGQKLFAAVCAHCHGDQGRGAHAGPLRDRALADLLSDQLLRRIIITGRHDLGMPNYVQLGQKSSLGRPLTSDEIVNLAGYVRFLQGVRGESRSIATAD